MNYVGRVDPIGDGRFPCEDGIRTSVHEHRNIGHSNHAEDHREVAYRDYLPGPPAMRARPFSENSHHLAKRL